MSEGDSTSSYKPSSTISQIQSDSNPHVNANIPSCDKNLHHFPLMLRVSSHLKEHNLLDPLDGSMLGLTKPSECQESDLQTNYSSNLPPMHFVNDSQFLMEPLLSSSKTSHSQSSQAIEKPASISNMRIGKEVIFTGTDTTIIGDKHIERSLPKKPHILLGERSQFTTNCKAFSMPGIQTSRKISGRKNYPSLSSLAADNIAETDDEIIALKVKIDFLYAKMNEMLQKCGTGRQIHSIIQNLHENEESKLNSSNSSINNGNGHGSGHLKIANGTEESVSCKAIRDHGNAKLSRIENSQINQFVIICNQNEDETRKQPIDTMNSVEEKKLEQPKQLCDTWERSNQFERTMLRAFQKPRKYSGIYQEKISSDMEAAKDIILTGFPGEMLEHQIKNNNQSAVSNQLGKRNSSSSIKVNKNSNENRKLIFPDKKLQQQKVNAKLDENRQKIDQYNYASYKMETDDTIIAVKRIQEFWNALYIPPHIRNTKDSLNTNIHREKVIQSTRFCFPQADYLTQSPTSNIGFQQFRPDIQSSVRFDPMLCFPNVSLPTRNYNCPYFPNPYSPFSQPEPVQLLTMNQ
ncbi:unnamed protein product, partial [Onchocerca ochengi]|uniref:Prospero domain-containing protein n=1 Tax=Onchocerca ochengi TaxID=42157 RepID=A0A182EE59_ONCOC